MIGLENVFGFCCYLLMLFCDQSWSHFIPANSHGATISLDHLDSSRADLQDSIQRKRTEYSRTKSSPVERSEIDFLADTKTKDAVSSPWAKRRRRRKRVPGADLVLVVALNSTVIPTSGEGANRTFLTKNGSWLGEESFLKRLKWRLTQTENAAWASICVFGLCGLVFLAILKTKMWNHYSAPTLLQMHDDVEEMSYKSASELLHSHERWKQHFSRQAKRILLLKESKRRPKRKKRTPSNADGPLIRL